MQIIILLMNYTDNEIKVPRQQLKDSLHSFLTQDNTVHVNITTMHPATPFSRTCIMNHMCKVTQQKLIIETVNSTKYFIQIPLLNWAMAVNWSMPNRLLMITQCLVPKIRAIIEKITAKRPRIEPDCLSTFSPSKRQVNPKFVLNNARKHLIGFRPSRVRRFWFWS